MKVLRPAILKLELKWCEVLVDQPRCGAVCAIEILVSFDVYIGLNPVGKTSQGDSD